MTTQFVISNGNFANNSIGFAAPVATGLQGWFFLGNTAAQTQKDLAFKANGVLTGPYTINPGYVSFTPATQTSCLQTGIMDTGGNITLLCVARSSDIFTTGPTEPRFISNGGQDPNYANVPNNIPGTKGLNITVSGTTGAPQCSIQGKDFTNSTGNSSGALNSTFTGAVTVPSSAAFNTNFRFFALSIGTVSGTTTRTIYDMTGSTSNFATTSSPITRAPNATNPFGIGSQPGGISGSCDIAFAAFYNVALTQTQIGTIYSYVKSYMSRNYSFTI